MSVESLSDAELRTKLAEYGFPVGPVTQTTRKILVKKLRTLMSANSGSRHSLARYSSDETDDDTATSSSNKKKKNVANTRRQTMANPMPPPSQIPSSNNTNNITTNLTLRTPSKRRTTASRNSESKEIIIDENDDDDLYGNSTSNRSNTVKIVQKKVKKLYTPSDYDGLETGSDTDVPDDIDNNYLTSIVTTTTTTSTSKSNDKNYNSTKDKTRNSVEPEKKKYESVATSSSRVSSILRDDKYTVPPFKSTISPIAPVKDDNYLSCKKDDLVSDLLSDYESPYLSEFTRRLSTQAAANLPSLTTNSSSTFKNPIRSTTRSDIKETDTNGHFSSYRPSSYTSTSTSSSKYISPSNDRSRDIVTRAYKTNVKINKEDNRNNQNMISVILLVVLALFFAVLAIVYLGLGGKNEFIPSLPMESEVPLCSQTDHDKPGVNCLLKENVETVMQLLKKLKPILMDKAVAAACEDNNKPPYLTDSEVINMLKSNRVKEIEVTDDLHNAQFLIFKNPKWGISLIEISDDSPDFSELILDSMEKVFQTRLEKKVGMIMLNPDLPIKCLIKQKVFTVISTLFILIIGVGTIIGGYLLIQWYIKQKKTSERELFQLVSEIISMVELHYQNAITASPSSSQDIYVAISHARDNLIQPKDRIRMSNLWEKAVKFVDENESRIRREVQQVAGEEFPVWRWLPNVNTSISSSSPGANKKSGKVWQGQAFETMEGSVNSLTCSPTPCLKIRHMFDPDVEFEEGWEIKVQDAILEKCGENVKILHIRVDRASREGCVYMKCMSQEDAGKAYRALHGCWFDGNLVTVKYLRLERYHERFPNSTNCTTPLKPSNNERLSMQAHYWQSPLEAN